MDRFKILDLEAKACFDFFWNEVSFTNEGYGLIRDNTGEHSKNVASIASVGFGLSAIVIGVERGWITYNEGYERALRTLKTVYNNVEQKEGFFVHFISMDNGKRVWNSEVSIIDTAILLMGAITCAEYFKGEVEEYFEKIYRRVNFQWYTDKKRNMFYMGYFYDSGFSGYWDLYAEQIMMYVLGAASPTFPTDPDMYYTFGRSVGRYKDYEFIYTWTGSLFTYQFSHAWIDFRNLRDKLGHNWFENSVKATLANRQYCIDNPEGFKTFHEFSWGMTACDSPTGYKGHFGAPPSGLDNTMHKNDGTIPPCGAIGSIVFCPEEVIDTMNYYYYKVPKLWGKYGFKDAYNLDVPGEWYSEIEIGIDKGISLLMIENYNSGLIWELTMRNKHIQRGLDLLGLKKERILASN